MKSNADRTSKRQDRVLLTFIRFRFGAKVGEIDVCPSSVNDGFRVFTRVFCAIFVVKRNLKI